MKFTIIKLRPKGPLHIGERENWKEGTKIHIPSDTFFSALCHSYLLLYGEVDSLLKGFTVGNPPFLISSAFPFWKENYFFPIPKNQISKDKELKKIRFVDLGGLKKLLSGERLDEVKDGMKTLPSFPCEIEDTPRISFNRWTNHPGENFFHFGQVEYLSDSGLFLLIEFKDINFKKKLISTFNFLSHEGVGGDRTIGKGLFNKPEVSEIEIEVTSNHDALYSLSMYYPLPGEIPKITNGYYELEDRKGYIFSPFCQSLRRRSVRMFTEGSVFPGNDKLLGNIVDVTPEAFKAHKVYRYGYIFSIPCRLEVL